LFDLLELLMFPQTDKVVANLGQRTQLPQITKDLNLAIYASRANNLFETERPENRGPQQSSL
jgi:hypothetical protein